MNDKKICFITCVKDMEVYQECLFYINSLIVPEGYEIETFNITKVDSVAKAYNAVMALTDAKYKVYLHECTFIINKTFIEDIVEIFSENDGIGLIGMVGTKMLPASCKIFDSHSLYGKKYTNKSGIMELVEFTEFNGSFEEVGCVDGVLMVTQYDINWREDIFNAWEYYDLAQNIEFLKKGYKIVVPNQNIPWYIEDTSEVVPGKDDLDKEIFAKEYYEFLFPFEVC